VIRKVIPGFVIQRWCCKTKQYVDQSFVASDEAVFEDGDGNPADEVPGWNVPAEMILNRLHPHMVQPGSIASLGIKRWIRDGCDMEEVCNTVAEVLEIAGRRMDKAYTYDICGDVVFEADNKKIYVGCVEFSIEEADPEYIKELEEEDDE
jgi:hypothetical protein